MDRSVVYCPGLEVMLGSEIPVKRTERASGMKAKIFTLLVVVTSFYCRADAPLADAPVVIGQPSIFWHNGEWQTYNDGVWTPYGKPAMNRFAGPRSKEGTAHSGPGIRDVEIADRAARGKSASLRRESNVGIGKTTIVLGQPNGIGQATGGMGHPNVGIGRSNIAIGQPNVGLGQPNGIGQTTIGVGKPNVGIGRNTTGIGQSNVGIGQPNGIGQTTIGIGKPSNFPNQQDTTR
jgi:hypothetical protein